MSHTSSPVPGDRSGSKPAGGAATIFAVIISWWKPTTASASGYSARCRMDHGFCTGCLGEDDLNHREYREDTERFKRLFIILSARCILCALCVSVVQMFFEFFRPCPIHSHKNESLLPLHRTNRMR